MKIINLFVLSRYQHILDGFFKSIMPTIDEDTRIYTITESLWNPLDERIIPIARSDFNPHKYFNKLKSIVPKHERDFVAIVNDDIRFSNNWLLDLREKLEKYSFVSNGFAETRDDGFFSSAIEATKNAEGVYAGQFDAFYTIGWDLFDKMGVLPEDIVSWYDIYFLLKLNELGYSAVTSKKVTIQHFGRTSFPNIEKDKKQIREEIVKRFGTTGLNIAKHNSINVRKNFLKYE